jgi:bacteriocin-like protein
MSFIKYFDRFRHLDSLIRLKATGDIKSLEKKLGLSRSTTLEYIKEMREMGFPIKYSKSRTSYYYEEEGKMVDHLFIKELTDEELKKINGGKTWFFLKSENTGL